MLNMLMTYFLICLTCARVFCGTGLLLLYKPKDITIDCAFSRHLRFDISFGMGMSDTITLVFRTLNDIEYECVVEVVTSKHIYMLVVVRYPNAITSNCAVNRDALTVLKRNRCIRLCDLLNREVYSPYYIFTVNDRLRFLFKSNSSINSDIKANFYQVTITSARHAPTTGCSKRNETICSVDDQNYCFTTGVVCDGIKNCGVDDWFDERKSLCSLPVEKLGYAPIIAVMAALFCFLLAGGHILLRCLPSHEKSFFIFNANEDNRLCIDPVLIPWGSAPEIEYTARKSIIPVDSLSTESDMEPTKKKEAIEKSTVEKNQQKEIYFQSEASSSSPQVYFEKEHRKPTMTERLQDRIKYLTKYALKETHKNEEKETFTSQLP